MFADADITRCRFCDGLFYKPHLGTQSVCNRCRQEAANNTNTSLHHSYKNQMNYIQPTPTHCPKWFDSLMGFEKITN